MRLPARHPVAGAVANRPIGTPRRASPHKQPVLYSVLHRPGWNRGTDRHGDGLDPGTHGDLDAGPSAITSGSSSTLTWSATNATSCTASGSWSGAMPVSGSQSTGPLT